jgi:cytochrome c peroxidase
VPSLRNVEKTAPYMHDGRFLTLEGVLEHYNSGVENSTTLDPILRSNGRLGIALTTVEKTQLIAFLKTLTDTQYLTDKRFSEY